LINASIRTHTGTPSLICTTSLITPITSILSNTSVTSITDNTSDLLTIRAGCVLHLGDYPGGTKGTTQRSLQRLLADCRAVENMTAPVSRGTSSGPVINSCSLYCGSNSGKAGGNAHVVTNDDSCGTARSASGILHRQLDGRVDGGLHARLQRRAGGRLAGTCRSGEAKSVAAVPPTRRLRR